MMMHDTGSNKCNVTNSLSVIKTPCNFCKQRLLLPFTRDKSYKLSSESWGKLSKKNKKYNNTIKLIIMFFYANFTKRGILIQNFTHNPQHDKRMELKETDKWRKYYDIGTYV
uniref:Uncharacterized protein n=1 Tax=Cacopsylla melanoneura TaxID=428564 RepID=A0A8D8X644_9HEMI